MLMVALVHSNWNLIAREIYRWQQLLETPEDIVWART